MELTKKDKLFLNKYLEEMQKVVDIYVDLQCVLDGNFPDNGFCGFYGGWGSCERCPVYAVGHRCLVTTSFRKSSLKREDLEYERERLYRRITVPSNMRGGEREQECIKLQEEFVGAMLYLNSISAKNQKKIKRLQEENSLLNRLFSYYMGDLYKDDFIEFFNDLKRIVKGARVI